MTLTMWWTKATGGVPSNATSSQTTAVAELGIGAADAVGSVVPSSPVGPPIRLLSAASGAPDSDDSTFLLSASSTSSLSRRTGTPVALVSSSS